MEHTTDTDTVEVVALDWDEHHDDRDRDDLWRGDDDGDDLSDPDLSGGLR